MKSFINEKAAGRRGLILLAFIAFIALGLPDGLLGVGWPSIRADFSVALDGLGMLLAAVMAGYLTSSFFSGKLITHLGIGWVLAASCAATGIGLIGYVLVPEWWMMVALGVVAGLGAGAIDSGLNTYVAANFGQGLMQWLHASYGIGISMGPIIMTIGLTTFSTWRFGYGVVGIFQLALAVCFALTLPMWERKEIHRRTDSTKLLTDYKTPFSATLRQPKAWLSLVLFFLYSGAEVSLGEWAYTLLTESRGIAPSIAGLWAGSYWAMFTVGRVLAGLYTRRLGVNNLIRGSLLGAILGAAILWWNPSEAVSLMGVGLVGFAIAPIYPALVSGTSQRIGNQFSANMIGMQSSAAMVGVAAIPGLIGVLAKRTSLEIIPACLFVMFVLLLVGYSLSMQVHKHPEPEPG